ncbi:phosphatase PAP2 family protein [Streptococcus moroccensis]|uniref:Undecaprenyl-diphosphatase n=1 Tax=Streptococcus moroccensis TaxID=1451356 RepID=A0ABT9YP03_9STRE|nr:phosphatase PAP2 family protein [Streptococcus moroccensis]MDQ0221612.1 undecaprenyl-diphosphatase [Streptococcus moroccensis]
MKNKQKYFTQGSFALLFFVILGYTVKFYPAYLTALDGDFQIWLRGELPDALNSFYRLVTLLGNTPIILAYTALIAAFFYYVRKWRAEGILMLGNILIMGVASTVLKMVYNRERPSLEYLIEDPIGASFPSWHAASTMIVALSLCIIMNQRVKTSQLSKRLLQALVILLAATVGVSRLYIGVHYPSDVLAGWLLAIAIASITYPFYDQKRFEWRFQSKQR